MLTFEPRVGWMGRLGAGLVGALALTGLHEGVRRTRSDAPRMDVVAMRALSRGWRAAGRRPPAKPTLYRVALAGDVLSNALYYALLLAGRPRHPLLRGVVGGALAGAGGLVLPQRLGLGAPPKIRRGTTRAMTVAWYLAGGLVAGIAYAALRRHRAP